MASNTSPAFASPSLVPFCDFLRAFLCLRSPFYSTLWLLNNPQKLNQKAEIQISCFLIFILV